MFFFSFSGTICLINFCFSNEAIFAVPCKPIGSGPNVETRSFIAGKPPLHHHQTRQPPASPQALARLKLQRFGDAVWEP